jgi:hypothetical protein
MGTVRLCVLLGLGRLGCFPQDYADEGKAELIRAERAG